MSILAFLGACRHGFERAVRAAIGSTSRTARSGRVVVQTYRGYSSLNHLFLMGRVFREASPELSPGHGFWHSLKTVWRLMRAWGIEGALLKVRFGDIEAPIKTDKDGYFRLDLDLPTPLPAGPLWRKVAIRLVEPVTIDAVGEVFVPRPDCSFAVISDIDDTIMHTGVANKLMMMWRLFAQGADSRTAIPGMAPFLRALHRGPRSSGANPMLYVSRAPWAIYGVLERFFHLHDIPAGPLLFLRDWGMTLQHPLPRWGKGHKRDLIRQMMRHHKRLPFILIGDSGQRDVETYSEIVKSFPDRILAIYIRDVGHDPKRNHTIAEMAAELASLGSPMIIASDIMTMATHAASQDHIASSELDSIEAELTMHRDGL